MKNFIRKKILKLQQFYFKKKMNPYYGESKPILYIDVSELFQHDHKTGIQRVVRSICSEIKKNNNFVFEVQLIYLTDENQFWEYKFVDGNIHNRLVCPQNGDVFLGLDLTGRIIHAHRSGLFDVWISNNVKMNFVIYDILPLFHPEWWTDDVSAHHLNWLTTVFELSNQVICISEAVANDVRNWGIVNFPNKIESMSIEWMHLGADVNSSIPTKGIPSNAEMILKRLKKAPSFLSVGTLEPRKGYMQALLAFERLWDSGLDVNYVIVGKKGWKMDEFTALILNHPEIHKRLFWLEAISDEYLEQIYHTSTCLLAPSEGEGFGLPLIEAAQYGLPIIARDIPVFREVAQHFAYYFDNCNQSDVLASSIQTWLELYQVNTYPKSDGMNWLTWKESAEQLIKIICKKS